MKRIIILGANGYIGRQLSQGLAGEAGGHLTLVSRNLDAARFAQICPRGDLISADFNETDRMVNICRKADIIIDLINATPPRNAEGAVAEDVENNLLPHITFFERMAERSQAKLIFFSSGGTVYGNADRLPIQEDAPARPISPYGASKLTLERYLSMFHAAKGMDYSILRVGNIYGPDQPVKRGQGVIPALLEAVFEDRAFKLFGEGRARRDYVYADDVIEAVKALIAAPDTSGLTLNIGSGRGHSVQDILQAFRQWSQTEPEIDHQEAGAQEVRDVILDISRARARLGWRPRVAFRDGLNRTFEHYAAHHAWRGR